ncbi:MAG: hypothetical protein EOR68_30780 [Mesorhizobium sp.]|uniref:hypothetical protein n=1 Tax=Mesorhizobium sp. TaxID=1871066 RepID=UPI000FE79760|nr:MAG: hypothetical protein EOR68_30780 [Mesorhizobium sp.]
MSTRARDVCDFVARMTDRYAMESSRLRIPLAADVGGSPDTRGLMCPSPFS